MSDHELFARSHAAAGSPSPPPGTKRTDLADTTNQTGLRIANRNQYQRNPRIPFDSLTWFIIFHSVFTLPNTGFTLYALIHVHNITTCVQGSLQRHTHSRSRCAMLAMVWLCVPHVSRYRKNSTHSVVFVLVLLLLLLLLLFGFWSCCRYFLRQVRLVHTTV